MSSIPACGAPGEAGFDLSSVVRFSPGVVLGLVALSKLGIDLADATKQGGTGHLHDRSRPTDHHRRGSCIDIESSRPVAQIAMAPLA